jgi:hypothetical protein
MLNYRTITSVTKIPRAEITQQLRPIFLFNSSFKLLTKMANNRMGVVAGSLINYAHAAFMKGKYIIEDLIFFHELLHSGCPQNSRNKSEFHVSP